MFIKLKHIILYTTKPMKLLWPMNSPIPDSLNLAEEYPGVCGLHVRSSHTTQVNRITQRKSQRTANPSIDNQQSLGSTWATPGPGHPTNNLNHGWWLDPVSWWLDNRQILILAERALGDQGTALHHDGTGADRLAWNIPKSLSKRMFFYSGKLLWKMQVGIILAGKTNELPNES